MIEVSGVSKRFGEVVALNDVSFSVGKGEIVGFLGANGAGKTTTMDILCGCIGADAGTAKIAGFDVTEAPLEAKRRLGYLPDVPPLHPEMTVVDFITYAAKLHRLEKGKIAARVRETIDALSLGDVRKRILANLSKGYRQRVALAQAIVHDPDVLVLDEPTEGLDPGQIVHIRELIRSLAGRHTIILSSHILSEVQNTCDHLVIINKGHIVAQGKYDELVASVKSARVHRLKVAKDHQLLVDLLRKTSGISDVHLLPNHADIEFSIAPGTDGERGVESVARIVLEGGYGLKEIAPKPTSLEEVFFQLTH